MASAANIISEMLINYEVYDETSGSNRLLGSASVDLPELEYQTADIKGAGVLGEYAANVLGQTNSLTATLHWRTIHSDWTLLAEPYAHTIALRGAQQEYDAGTGVIKVVPVLIRFRGRPTKSTLGKFEPGESTDSESEFSLDRIKIDYNGQTIWEIDKNNYIFIINGIDYVADLREAVGRN